MSDWSPVAILPNLRTNKVVDGEVIALANCHDPRVQAFLATHPKFTQLLLRFTNAFEVPLEPAILIVRDDVISQLDGPDPIMSFRDLVAMSVVPYARSLNSVYNTSNRIVYSNSFWLYPWITGRDTEYLTASTPAFQGVHVVEQFHGQSSPEMSVMKLRDVEIDSPLLEELLRRWKRYYLRKRQSWQDRHSFAL